MKRWNLQHLDVTLSAASAAIFCAVAMTAIPGVAQRPRFDQRGPMPVNQAPSLPQSSSPGVTPQTKLAPIPQPTTPPSMGAQLGSPMFDPYEKASNGGGLDAFSSAGPSNSQPFRGIFSGFGGGNAFNGNATAAPLGPQPFGTAGFGQTTPTQTYGAPGPAAAPGYGPASPFGESTPPTYYPPSAYPNGTPSTLFPGGVFNGTSGDNVWGPISAKLPEPLRLIQGPRIQHAWLAGGDDPADLDINDTDVSVAFAFPNFLYSTQPLYVLPSFSLHLWDGPQGASGGSADLPGQAYSAFIDAGWQTDPMRILGAELGVRVGVFTDFETMNSDSLRVQGRGLGIFRLSPTMTFKAGVLYLDRNDIKLLPAGGVLWQPHPLVRYDIFFPEPKAAHYVRTIGVYDVWCYLAGEFGGGSWTIERANGTEDSVDINDIRVLLGFEWGRSDLIRTGQRTGFIEVGYVFEREVEYLRNPADDFDPNNTFMVRLGIGY